MRDKEYIIDIIVGVRREGRFAWYLSEKEFWFLDLGKLRRAFEEAGYEVSESDEDRFNIEVVDDRTAPAFLEAMDQDRVTTAALQERIQSRARSEPHDIALWAPDLFVDFDGRRLLSQFPEPASFEEFVPDGWIGEYAEVAPHVPEAERYWIVNGQDLLASR